VVLCLATVLLLASTTDEIGWTCDEVYYFSFAENITEWFQELAGGIKTSGLSF